jgi:hypothetical protein
MCCYCGARTEQAEAGVAHVLLMCCRNYWTRSAPRSGFLKPRCKTERQRRGGGVGGEREREREREYMYVRERASERASEREK